MAAKQGLSLVIPVYNEGPVIEYLTGRLDEIRKAANRPLEFILVNDGSNDGSERHLVGLGSDDLKVISHETNRGYGASLKTGIRAAKFDWVAITDADDTYPDDRIPEFFEKALTEDLDMVVGARIGQDVNIPLLRRPPKWALRKMASILGGVNIPDLNSGLRIMRKSVVEKFVHLLPQGFSFTSSITLAMLSSGYRVEYVPIDYKHRGGQSKIRPIYDTLNFMQLILRTALWFNPLRVFLAVSLSLFGLAGLVLLASWLFLEKPMDVTFGVLVITGVLFLAIGMLADLIDKRLS